MRRSMILSVILVLLSFSTYAQDMEERLPGITVIGERVALPTKQTGETVYTGFEITSKGLEILGEKGKSNVYVAVQLLPGVILESPDPGNLATEQSNIRIRGVRGYLGAMTVEGVPNYGGNPMGPRAYIYDSENFQSIAVYKGAVPSDLGVGVGNRGGAIELRPLWAEEKFSLKASQTLGSYDYRRTYLRLDSGKNSMFGTRMSLSYSHTTQDKWKGPGDIGPRHNMNLTLVQPFGENLEIKIWGNFNEIDHEKYRFLTYAQTKNLDTFYRLDFNENLTGTPASDYLYYKFNKEHHINRDLFAFLTIRATEGLRFLFKPYLSGEDAKIYDGSSSIQGRPGVQKRTRDIDKKGIIGEVTLDTRYSKFVIGYHHEASDMDIYSENYWINSDGSLSYRGYGVMATTGTTYINSPYFKVSGTHGGLNWQAGLKYFRFEDSESEGYVSQFVGGQHVLVRAPDLDRPKKTYEIWLPTAGISYGIGKDLEACISYGRTFIRPYAYMPILSLYNRLRNHFLAKGITVAELFRGRDIERSDNIDFGIRYRKDFIELNPTLFLSKHKKLLTVVTDPRVIDPSTGRPVNYQQNVGKAKGYGLEFSINLFPSEHLTLYLNPTYNRLTYDGDITYNGETLSTDGKQVVDTPKLSVTTGMILKWGNFRIIPQAKFVGKRYGDAQHNERIPSYTVFDLKLGYSKEKAGFFRSLNFSLEFDNIFNKRYISVINAMDDAITGTTYGVGAPFSVKAGISFSF